MEYKYKAKKMENFLFNEPENGKCQCKFLSLSGKVIFEGECEVVMYNNRPWAKMGKSEIPLIPM